jgi:hypothetical protein
LSCKIELPRARPVAGATVEEMLKSFTVAEWRISNIKGLALGQWGAPNIVNCTVGAGIVSALT